jgi:hypothetical protein
VTYKFSEPAHYNNKRFHRPYKGVGSPGVGGAHVQRVRRCGADLPPWFEFEQLAMFVNKVDGARIVVSEGFVDVAVEDDALVCGLNWPPTAAFLRNLTLPVKRWDDSAAMKEVVSKPADRSSNPLKPFKGKPMHQNPKTRSTASNTIDS